MAEEKAHVMRGGGEGEREKERERERYIERDSVLFSECLNLNMGVCNSGLDYWTHF